MPWEEVALLVSVLLNDPSSWLQTTKNKWSHPIDYNWTIAAATYDLMAAVNSKRKPKPWPRPWNDTASKNKGRKVRRDARAILQRAKDGVMEWQKRHTPM